ncbi:arginine utilization regulatory protein [Maridesulfovibrio ferrireducens]|uniref:Arginine utilization regulatory protein n=1 Tax=Maridesulfovibrio ferrireducens TaxID=246191 RepID=A0A1G9BAE9_9BACT|nr:sigma 54-interacting transcriptional regulator [Maridesulfovibrio ferrireducens]SDK36498.1 arginine utilization regulatory protein [Maridesulfovibrio ferrireducens]
MKPIAIHNLFPDVDPSSIPFLSILDQFYAGVVIADAAGKILYYNDAQGCIDNLDPNKVIGRMVTDLYRVDDDDTPIINCMESGKPLKNHACYYRTWLGKIVNSIHNVYPLYSHEKLLGAICFVSDYSITRQTLETISQPYASREIKTFKIPTTPAKSSDKGNGTRFSFKDIIGESPELVKAVESARMASDSPSSIMLHGETGTGKELMAQSIHNTSARKDKSFIAINCAAIPEHLLEGILFGTAKGAFTGALDKQGLFERADGGTLFLDEINSMSIGLQSKLLRVIQERKVRRVGSLKETDMDIRIISSVNEDPHQAAERGALRYDLLYRLGVLIIRIPPLRERIWDLEKLVRHFLHKHSTRLGKKINAISADVMELFHNHHWIGNVRELEHVIEGAVNLVSDGEAIKIRHLPDHINKTTASLPNASRTPSRLTEKGTAFSADPFNVIFPTDHQAPATTVSPQGKSLAKIQAENESRTIREMLKFFQGNVSKAARKLDVSPQLLNYKMKKHNIHRKDFLL